MREEKPKLLVFTHRGSSKSQCIVGGRGQEENQALAKLKLQNYSLLSFFPCKGVN